MAEIATAVDRLRRRGRKEWSVQMKPADMIGRVTFRAFSAHWAVIVHELDRKPCMISFCCEGDARQYAQQELARLKCQDNDNGVDC